MSITCQEIPSVLTIQQRLIHAQRLRRDNDSRLEIAIREYDALLAERREIEAEIRAAALCYRDARAAKWLREQGAGAVAEACAVWGVE